MPYEKIGVWYVKWMLNYSILDLSGQVIWLQLICLMNMQWFESNHINVTSNALDQNMIDLMIATVTYYFYECKDALVFAFWWINLLSIVI